MKSILMEIDLRHLLIADLDAGRIAVGVQFGMHGQTGAGTSGADQLHHRLVSEQWLPAPVVADAGKQAVLDLVPLAGTRRQVADLHAQAGFVGQALQFPLPRAQAVAVAAAGVGADQQASCLRIALAAHAVPPPADARDGKGDGVVVGTDIDPAGVGTQIVDAVGNRFDLGKIVIIDRLRLAARAPGLAGVLEAPYQFLLLGVDRDHRLARRLMALDAGVEVLELGIAIHMLRAFQRLAVGLQAVAQFVQQFCDPYMTDRMPLRTQRLGQRACALAGPAQRRIRIATAQRFDQPLQIAAQRRIEAFGALAPATGATHPSTGRAAQPRLVQLPAAPADKTARQPRRRCHRRDAAPTQRLRFGRRPQPPLPLIQMLRQVVVTLPNRIRGYVQRSVLDQLREFDLFVWKRFLMC